MNKKIKMGLEFRFIKFIIISLLVISMLGCEKKEKDETEFVEGKDGLVMSFIPNAPQDKYIVSNTDEPISIAIDVWNKGAHPGPPSDDDPGTLEEEDIFKGGVISISGFDNNIIEIEKKEICIKYDPSDFTCIEKKEVVKNFKSFLEQDVYLPPASPLNPRGGLYTTEFDGNIKVNKIVVDKYEPTILVTACYPYFTHAAPSVCIDPFPFDTRQEKVCNIGGKTLEPQGAPVAITKIEQEASKGKIRFKITIENVGKGDVIWANELVWPSELSGLVPLMALIDRCSPADLGPDPKILDRKDFDKVQLIEVKVANADLLEGGKCTPFMEGTNNIIRLFDGEGLVICTYDVPSDTESAYITPISIKLSYAYRSTISKPISIKKIE